MATHRTFLLVLSFLYTLLFSPIFVFADVAFENTAIVRTVELGGTLVHVRTTFAVRALETGANIYTFALGKKDGAATSFIEARIKGEQDPIDVQEFGYNEGSGLYLYAIVLPKGLKKNESLTLELDTVQARATYAWPKKVSQGEEHALKYDTDLFIVSPYATAIQRTKIRAPSPKIISFTEPKDLDAYTLDAAATKSGATITYGPFNNIPASASRDFVNNSQKRVTVHFKPDLPVMEIVQMKRTAEISHWGSNLNIQDELWFRNSGPELRGHFSRLEHMHQQYFQKNSPHPVRGINLQLPPGISNVYIYDRIGNVSTSRLRTAPSVPKGTQPKQYSVLEFRPRYPIMGGWNYSFTLGWDSALQDSASYDRDGRTVVAVPIATLYPDALVNEAEVTIILPEGATEIDVYPPFAPKSSSLTTHKTFLDTIGRPAITFNYERLTDRHMGTIYVVYKVPFLAHLRKPMAVTAVVFGFFTFFMGARRVNTKIHRG